MLRATTATLVSLIACGSVDPGTDPDRLTGITWVLDDASVTALVGAPVPRVRAEVSFDGKRANGSSGCNLYSGTYVATDGGSISVEAVSMTEMACDEPRMALEAAFIAELADVSTFAIGDGTLMLGGGATPLRFTRYVPMAPLPLEGTHWILETIVAGPGAVTSVVAGTEPTLLLDGDQASGSAGCNRFTGTFELTTGDAVMQDVTGDLSFGPLATTRMACPGPVMEQERTVLTVLGATTTWLVDADRLSLFDAGGSLLLTFRGSAG